MKLRPIALAVGLALGTVAVPAQAAPVVVAVAAAAASIVVPTAIGIAVGTIAFAVVGAVAAVGTSVVLGGLLNKPGPQSPGSGFDPQPTFQAEMRDRLHVVRSAIETRRIIYGQVMVSGPLVYAEVTGTSNEYLHMVIPLAGHECQEIGDCYLNDELVGTLDGSGNVTTGRFAGFVRIKKHLGTAAQTADSDLVAESASLWTTNHRLRGITYAILRLKWSEDVFPTGIPNVKFVVKGKKLYDPRSATTAWSDNWALVERDYLTAEYGLACDSSELDDTLLQASANICDEQVALDDPATTYQSRYTCNGTVNLADRPVDIIRSLNTAAAGAAVFTQGVWKVYPGAYVTPSADIDESWLRGPVKVQPRKPRRELYNKVRGTIASRAELWQPTDFPPVTNSTYVTQDNGEEIARDIVLPFTDNAIRAQRIGKIHLEKSRQSAAVVLPCNLKAFGVAVWDTVRLSIDRLGYDEKVFQVLGWTFNPAGGVDLTLQEEASAVYDWDAGDATELDAAPDTVLPNPFGDLDITMGTPVSGTAELYVATDGTVFPRIRAPFTPGANPYVKYFEVQFARSAGSPQEWQDAPDVVAPATQAYMHPVETGVAYDGRIRAVTTLGNAGAWAYFRGHTVAGKTALPSNVSGFSAVQKGDVVVFDTDRVTDADLDSIEIRFVEVGGTWENASPVSNILRGETSTDGSIPPGAWDMLAKAKDTSGNYSQTEARISLEVTAEGFTSIESEEQAPDWLGAKTNMVEHWTGVLTPDSQSLASVLDWEVFDEFVPDAYTDCYYEAPVIDKGIDATARIWADVVSVLGPGETSGVANPKLQVDTRLAAGAFDGFESWTIGTAEFRYLKARIYVDTTLGKPVLSGFEVNVDGQARTEEFRSQSIGASGTTITWSTPFHNTPVVQITPVGTTALIPSAESPSTTNVIAHLYNTAGAGAAGTANVTATGV